jgi:ABC-type multidrug transport system ATPase subunit
MLQRIGLAQAIVHNPRLVLLDEPTSALDPIGRREVRDLIRGLSARGMTVFLNSHLLSEVEMVCDRVAIIDRGNVVRSGRLLAPRPLRRAATLEGVLTLSPWTTTGSQWPPRPASRAR